MRPAARSRRGRWRAGRAARRRRHRPAARLDTTPRPTPSREKATACPYPGRTGSPSSCAATSSSSSLAPAPPAKPGGVASPDDRGAFDRAPGRRRRGIADQDRRDSHEPFRQARGVPPFRRGQPGHRRADPAAAEAAGVGREHQVLAGAAAVPRGDVMYVAAHHYVLLQLRAWRRCGSLRNPVAAPISVVATGSVLVSGWPPSLAVNELSALIVHTPSAAALLSGWTLTISCTNGGAVNQSMLVWPTGSQAQPAIYFTAPAGAGWSPAPTSAAAPMQCISPHHYQ